MKNKQIKNTNEIMFIKITFDLFRYININFYDRAVYSSPVICPLNAYVTEICNIQG